MATRTRIAIPERRRFNVDEYCAMAEAGILDAGEGVELRDGELSCRRDETRRRFTVDEYYQLTATGILTPTSGRSYWRWR